MVKTKLGNNKRAASNTLCRVSSQNHDVKLGIEGFVKHCILKFRAKCKNIKIRHVFFKLISGDIFSLKTLRFGMLNNSKCESCEQVETTRRLLWEY